MAATVIKLHPHEAAIGYAEIQSGLYLLSIYEKTDALSGAESVDRLQTRMGDILNANTWLMSRLRKSKENSVEFAQLEVDPNCIETDRYISRSADKAFFEAYNESTDRLHEVLDNYGVAPAKLAMGASGNSKNPGQALTRFSIVEDPDSSKICIIVCINHGIADAHTLYKIWKMLDIHVDVTTINPVRVPGYSDLLNARLSVLATRDGKRLTAEDYLNDFLKKYVPAALLNSIGYWFTGLRPKTWLCKLNSSWIRDEKAKYTDETGYVSTNDVLTSWLASALGSDADLIYMPINLRGRIPEFDDNRAGNYMLLPTFRKPQLESPKTVREELNNFLRDDYDWECLSFPELRKCPGIVHTNWTSFYHNVEPVGLRQIAHMPSMKDQYLSVGPLYIGFSAFAITYMSSKDEMSMVLTTYDNKTDNEKVIQGEVFETVILKP